MARKQPKKNHRAHNIALAAIVTAVGLAMLYWGFLL